MTSDDRVYIRNRDDKIKSFVDRLKTNCLDIHSCFYDTYMALNNFQRKKNLKLTQTYFKTEKRQYIG